MRTTTFHPRPPAARRLFVGSSGGASVVAFLLLLLLQLFCSSDHHHCVFLVKADGMEATWTPKDNVDDGSGPLPLSMQQRQQLLQLEQAIRNSPDPDATLQQVAESNNMDVQELQNMLLRNHHDMEQGGVDGGGVQNSNNTITSFVKRILMAFFTILMQVFRKHPQRSSLVLIVLTSLWYVRIQAPKTGMVLSPTTTIWSPPNHYVQNCLRNIIDESDYELSNSSTNLWKKLVVSPSKEDGITWYPLPTDKKKNKKKRKLPSYQWAVTAQVTIPRPPFFSALDTNKEKDDEEDHTTEALGHYARQHSSSLLFQRRDLTEWSPDKDLRLIVVDNNDNENSGDSDLSVLVVPRLGDYGRYGWSYLQVSHEHEAWDTHDLVLTTLQGLAHWDGQLHVSVQFLEDDEGEEEDNDDENWIRVRTTLVVGQGGATKRRTRKAAQQIVQDIAQSVAQSIQTRTQQSMVRQGQSKLYKRGAQQFAKKRISHRSEKERELEEMASDRRRRWQRKNPNAGSYRPSGDRMRSPNNAIYY